MNIIGIFTIQLKSQFAELICNGMPDRSSAKQSAVHQLKLGGVVFILSLKVSTS
jgi:hypothetical protein